MTAARKVVAALVLAASIVLAAVLLDDGREPVRNEPVRGAPPVAGSPSGALARGLNRSSAEIVVRRGRRDYVLRGRLDLRRGYRLLADVEGRRVPPQSELWLDDHPPTLPLFRRFEPTGAEDFVHLALVALTEGEWGASFDFRGRDRPTGVRDADNWSIRPLARLVGETELDVAEDGGRLTRLGFAAEAPGGGTPVTVDLRLLPGRARGVGLARRGAIE